MDDVPHVQNLKGVMQVGVFTRQKQTADFRNELTVSGAEDGEGTGKEFRMDMETLLYLKWITKKDPLQSTGNSAQWHVAAWMGGEFGGEGIHVYV